MRVKRLYRSWSAGILADVRVDGVGVDVSTPVGRKVLVCRLSVSDASARNYLVESVKVGGRDVLGGARSAIFFTSRFELPSFMRVAERGEEVVVRVVRTTGRRVSFVGRISGMVERRSKMKGRSG